ncbi:hypothetical protein [Halomonas sp. AOP42-A1-14]|uniref:hypothetical protein n=1 Tax=Halomonas sp. AOP42-A1-14 TaxID=3457676 RepID=UPI0040333CCA
MPPRLARALNPDGIAILWMLVRVSERMANQQSTVRVVPLVGGRCTVTALPQTPF